MPAPADARLPRREKVLLGLLVFLLAALGVMTEIRSAQLSTRRTDFYVYTHAAWAVRTGEDIYSATTPSGMHYVYPSAFAVLMLPFAEVPPWAKADGFYVPFSVSVAVWYLLSVVFLGVAVHLFARAVLPDAVRGSRRWWYARTMPFCVCLGGVGFSLARGQVNMMLVAMFAAAFAAAVANRRVASGVWLGFTIVLKVIPAVLLLFPFVRKDWRAGAGVAAAAVIGLVVVPVAVWGPQKAIAQHTYFVKNVVLAGASSEDGKAVGKELTETTATDSQSFVAALHHLRHANTPRELRPRNASRNDRLLHWAISGVLVFLTLLAARRLTASPGDQLVYFGCACAVMTVITPVSHMHYYAFVLPLAAGLWLRSVAGRPGEVFADRRTFLALSAWGVATAVPLFPGVALESLRDMGFGTAATVLLWGFGLSRIGKPSQAATGTAAPLLAA